MENILNWISDNYPYLRIIISAITSFFPVAYARIYPRYVQAHELSEILSKLHRLLLIWLVSTAIQIYFIFHAISIVLPFFAILNLTISTLVLVYLINCWIVIIAIRSYDQPIKYGSKALIGLSGIDIELMKLFLRKNGFIQPLPEELEAQNVIRLVATRHNLPELDRQLMNSTKYYRDVLKVYPVTEQQRKEFAECDHPLTPSERKEEEQRDPDRFLQTENAAFKDIHSIRFKAMGWILLLSATGLAITYLFSI